MGNADLTDLDGEISYLNRDDGVSIRYGLFPTVRGVEGRGTIVLLPGRTEFIEKYGEVIGELGARGYCVAILDWRSHGLSSRALKNRYKHHIENFGALIDDLAAFVSGIVQPRMPGPLFGLAHSMGAHCLLRYLHDDPGEIERAVLTAPMIGIQFRHLPPSIAAAVVGILSRMGLSRTYAFGQGDYGMVQGTERIRALLTSDAERYQCDIAHIEKNPDLALGGVTFGWLDAAFRSMRQLDREGYAEAIGTPVLALTGGADRVVDNDAIRKFVARMPNGRTMEIPDARHEIMRERDELRQLFWQAFDRFIGVGGG